MPENNTQTARVIKSAVPPREVMDAYIAFMNQEIGENGESFWDYFTGTKTDESGKLVMNLKHANSKKQQGYLSDFSEVAVPLPDYLTNRTIRLAGQDVTVGQITPKAYLWDVVDPNAFRIDDKNAEKALAATGKFLSEHPELQSLLGISKETADTLARLRK